MIGRAFRRVGRHRYVGESRQMYQYTVMRTARGERVMRVAVVV